MDAPGFQKVKEQAVARKCLTGDEAVQLTQGQWDELLEIYRKYPGIADLPCDVSAAAIYRDLKQGSKKL